MKKKEKISKIITLTFFLFFSVWSIIQIISPIFLPDNSIDNLSGSTGVYNNKEIFNKKSFPLNLIYNIGDIFCHQKSDRSLYINGNQMPFCSRCTAIWFGIAIGLFFMIFYTISLNNKFIFIIFIGIIPLGIDGLGQLLGFWESTNLIRVITGIFTGIICGLVIGVIIQEIVNYKK